MLGLPSTTEVGRRIPKEAFYRHMKLPQKVRDSFVRDIESITVANSVKASTANIAEGKQVHEILVVRVDLKGSEVPVAAIEAINSANEGRKLFVCIDGEQGCLAVRIGGKTVVGPWVLENDLVLDMGRGSLDELWDTLASQVLYDDKGVDGKTVEERFAKDQKMSSLKAELAKVEAKMRKEKQFAKKNELFAEAKELKAELADLEKGM